MMKKVWTLLLVLALVVCMLAGCAQGTAPSQPAAEAEKQEPAETAETAPADEAPAEAAAEEPAKEPSLIGSNIFGTGAYAFDMYRYWFQLSAECVGDKYTYLDDNYNEGNILDNIKSLVAGGADAVIGLCVSDSSFIAVSEFCGENNVPFACSETATEQSVADAVKAQPTFCGAVAMDNKGAAKEIAQMAIDAGCRKAMVIAQPVGNSNGTMRTEAFVEAFEAAGGTVVGIVNCDDASDGITKGENLFLANPDVDLVLGTGSDFAVAGVSVLQNHPESKAIVYSIEIDSNVIECLEKGLIQGACGDNFLYGFQAGILLQHFLKTGEKVVGSDGLPIFFQVSPGVLTPACVEFYKALYMNGNCPYTEDEIHWMVYEATSDELREFINNCSVLERIEANYKAGIFTEEQITAAGLSF